MSLPKKARDMCQPPPEHGNFASNPRELPELKIPDTINDDILRAAMLASEGVTIQSEAKLQEAKDFLDNIMATIEKMKNEKGGLEQDDDTWTFKAYNEIAAVYGVLGMPQQEKKISKNLLVMMEARRGPNDQETLSLSRETPFDTGNGATWRMQYCFLNVLKKVNRRNLERTASMSSKIPCVLLLLLRHFH